MPWSKGSGKGKGNGLSILGPEIAAQIANVFGGGGQINDEPWETEEGYWDEGGQWNYCTNASDDKFSFYRAMSGLEYCH